MRYEMIIFDLDGTLTNPELGFVNGINHALNTYGLPAQAAKNLAQYIGPPIDHTMLKLANGEQDLAEKLLIAYRSEYSKTGYQENLVYDGVAETLQKLYDLPQVRLGVCTSKKQDFAIKILKMHGLFDYFEFVSGAETGTSKSQQLAELLASGKAPKNSIMTGDRLYDLRAAQNNQLDCAGVLWGFGGRDELAKYDPQYIFDQPSQWLQLAGAI
ncbi:MAG: HAD hydrolase-like protein [Rhizobiales bacterium]|nr:HAD hydrolase-like protein [Hyphomicrobiales bacterium]NRB14392.1 HAD hydrolase-like protein [Hyphomicrobiales bacterium]